MRLEPPELDAPDLVAELAQPARIAVEPQLVMAMLADTPIAVSTCALRYEPIADRANAAPTFFIPQGDVQCDLLEPQIAGRRCAVLGDATLWAVGVGAALHRGAAWRFNAPPAFARRLAGYVAFSPEIVAMRVGAAFPR